MSTPQLPSEGAAPNLKGLPGMTSGEAPLIAEAPVKRRKGSSQLVLVVLLFAVSGAALFGMRHLGARAGMDMTIAEVNWKFGDDKDAAEKAKSYERIMSDLQRMQRPLDVAMGDFQKSPFMLDMPEQVEPVPLASLEDEEAKKAELARREAMAKRDQVKKAVEALQLQSVLGGAKPMARINGETFRLGEKINGMFVVQTIRGREREVVLDHDGEEFTISMQPAIGANKNDAKGKGH